MTVMLKQSESTPARRVVYFVATVIATDTPYTGGLSGSQLQISKAGGPEVQSSGSATHIANGMFKYEFAIGEVDTLGTLSLRLAEPTIYGDVYVYQVVAFDPYDAMSLGLARLDTAVGTRLASSAYTSPDTLLTLPDGIENGYTLRSALRIILSALAGRLSGAGTGTETFRDINNTKNRIIASVDTNNNRTNVTTDPT